MKIWEFENLKMLAPAAVRGEQPIQGPEVGKTERPEGKTFEVAVLNLLLITYYV